MSVCSHINVHIEQCSCTLSCEFTQWCWAALDGVTTESLITVWSCFIYLHFWLFVLLSVCSWRLLLHDIPFAGPRVWWSSWDLFLPGDHLRRSHVHPGGHWAPTGEKHPLLSSLTGISFWRRDAIKMSVWWRMNIKSSQYNLTNISEHFIMTTAIEIQIIQTIQLQIEVETVNSVWFSAQTGVF